jgi:hypothetical protein
MDWSDYMSEEQVSKKDVVKTEEDKLLEAIDINSPMALMGDIVTITLEDDEVIVGMITGFGNASPTIYIEDAQEHELICMLWDHVKKLTVKVPRSEEDVVRIRKSIARMRKWYSDLNKIQMYLMSEVVQSGSGKGVPPPMTTIYG